MPRRYILTGAPGAGKTALIRHLETLGHEIVEEAATDVIALSQASGVERPWERPSFVTDIAALQQWREGAPARGERRFSDRSMLCTVALAEWLGHPLPRDVLAAVDQLVASHWFERRIFFIEQLGFIQNTDARRISFDDATRFGLLHQQVYQRYGFEPFCIGPATIPERAALILAASS
jgi:predicted ATPase